MVAAFEKDDQHSATQLKCRQTSSLTPLSETQQGVVGVCWYGVGHVEVRCQPREELFCDITNFHECFLRMPGEDVECPVRRFRDRVIDSFGDIDVEAGTADDLAGLVDQSFADYRHRARRSSSVDDAVPAAERAAGSAERFQRLSDMRLFCPGFDGDIQNPEG